MPALRAVAPLAAYASNQFSQFGEDGIIARILDSLPQTDRWCVEFGAWDGIKWSNTRRLITTRGYSAVLIEAHPERFATLRQQNQGRPEVTCLQNLVGFGPEDGLDHLLAPLPIPLNFDVLSIDVDGNDYHCWAAIERYQPKLVVIEFNQTIPDDLEFVQPADPQVAWGSSLHSLALLGARKGYQLAAVTFCNAIFVDQRHFPSLGIAPSSPADLRTNRSAVTSIFQGLDGTVFVRGSCQLHWHGLLLDERAFQVLPPALRRFPDGYDDDERLVYERFGQLYRRILRKDPAAALSLCRLGTPSGACPPLDLDPHETRLWSALHQALVDGS
jgi:hypothetical protein